MKPFLILYATREGHTYRIAEHIAARLIHHGISGDLRDAAHLPDSISLERYSTVFICASVHRGQHEPEIVHFVKHHRRSLELVPAAFLSVSLSEAGVEDASASPAHRAQAAADVERMINDFLKETGWRPSRIKAVAGALLYTKYNFVLRFIMKRIAQQAGGPTDTSHDHDLTDWNAVDRFVDQCIPQPASAGVT